MIKKLVRYSVLLLFLLLFNHCTSPSSPDFKNHDTRQEYTEIWQILRVYYYFPEEVPADPFKYTNPSELFACLSDPWTLYIPPDSVAIFGQYFAPDSAAGLGIFVEYDDNGHYYISHAVEGSGAAAAGLLLGDTLISVNGYGLTGISIDTLFKYLRGTIGSQARLEIGRAPNLRFTVQITRGYFPIPIAYQDTLDSRVAYLRLTTFLADAYNELLPLLQSTDTFPVTVLDLRSNVGGYISECEDLASEFLKRGDTLVRVRFREYNPLSNRGETIDSVLSSSKDGPFMNRKVVVLVDSNSASATEIFSAALLHNNKNAYFMGTRTFGKARGQFIDTTFLGGLIKVTTMGFTTAKGFDYNTVGLVPNSQLDSTSNSLAEAHAFALKWVGLARANLSSGEKESNRVKLIELNRKLNQPCRPREIPLIVRKPFTR